MSRNIKTKSTSIHTNDGSEYLNLLNSISDSWQKIRRENEYNGEAKLLLNFTKRNKTKYYTTPFEKGLDNIMTRKNSNKNAKNNDSLITHLQRQESYSRINSAKN